MNKQNIKAIFGKSFTGNGVQSLMKNAEKYLSIKKKNSLAIKDMKAIFDQRLK